MDKNDAQSFALGIIVAAILFLLFRREFDKLANRVEGGKGTDSTRSLPETTDAGGCGCSGKKGRKGFPTNPDVSIGNQSYNDIPFGSSTVSPSNAN